MRRQTRLIAIAIVIAATAIGCERQPTFGRLVDPSQRIGAVSEPESLSTRAPTDAATRADGVTTLPTATIEDDTRYVLANHPHRVIATRENVVPVEPNRVVFESSVAGFFPDASHLLIDVQYFVLGQKEWQEGPPTLRPLEELGDDQILEIEFEVEDSPPGAGVQLWVEAYHAPPVGGTRYSTHARMIPDGSRLELAFGIMKAARDQGPVHFAVSACQRDDCESLFSEVFDPALEGRAPWQDRTISLSPVWGQTRSLVFEAVPVLADARSLPVWANPVVATEPAAPTRPNVIMLSVDTLRRDHLDVYGYERETAPFIRERLAARGVVFDNVVSEAATTEVSHMSLFTSLPGLVHGVTDYETRLSVPVMPIAEAFRNAGYDTAAFTEAGPLDRTLGFDIGFDRWKANPNAHFLFPVGQVDRVFDQARDWLGQRRNRAFFLFLHTFQVHFPLGPPRAYRDLFVDEGVELTPEEREVTLYDQEIRYVDDQLALLWNDLSDRGLTQNTIFVLVSDHGDEFWEHGRRGHDSLPYEELMAVPLIMVGPGLAEGLTSQKPLHHIDVMPTILELAGLPVPEHVLGKSFAASARGEDEEAPESPRSGVRTSATWITPDGIPPPIFAVRDGGYKVIRYEDESGIGIRCFDLETDPDEETDLCAEGETEQAGRLLKHLETYLAEMVESRRSLGGAPLGDDETEGLDISPEKEAQLRALGYIEDDVDATQE